MSLEKYSVEELQEELEKRKKISLKPKKFHEVDWHSVYDYCIENINHIAEKGYEMKDFDSYLSASVIELIYGNNIFAWIDKRIN